MYQGPAPHNWAGPPRLHHRGCRLASTVGNKPRRRLAPVEATHLEHGPREGQNQVPDSHDAVYHPEQLWLPAFRAMPVIVRNHGIAEAHTHPLVGRRRLDDTIYSWRTLPQYAWVEPLLEWARTSSAYVALAYDIDSQTALETGAWGAMEPKVR